MRRTGKEGKSRRQYINAINPTNAIVKKGILNLEKGYDLDMIWSEFNGILRNSISKKVGRAVLYCYCFNWFYF